MTRAHRRFAAPFTLFGAEAKTARPPGGLHLSATRNKTFMRHCKRLWAFQHIAGEKTPEMPWHLFGRSAHSVAEAYLRDGALPDPATLEGRLFLTGAHHWPEPSEKHVVEGTFATKLTNGQWFTGTMDLACGRPELYSGLEWARGWPVLGDHKFIGGEAFQYAMTEAELAADVQALSYAHHVFEMWDRDAVSNPEAWVAAQWVYYQKPKKNDIEAGKPKFVPAKAVRTFISRAQAAAGWAETVEASNEMVGLWHAKADPMSLPKPANAGCGDRDSDPCEAFGGCYFKHRCHPNQRTSLLNDFLNPAASTANNGDPMPSVFARINSQAQQQPASAPAPQAPAPASQQATRPAIFPAPAHRAARPPAPAPAAPPQEDTTTAEDFALMQEDEDSPIYDAQFDEGPAPAAPPVNAGAPVLSPQAQAIVAARKAEQAEQAAAAAQAAAPAPTATAAPASAPRLAKRPKKEAPPAEAPTPTPAPAPFSAPGGEWEKRITELETRFADLDRAVITLVQAAMASKQVIEDAVNAG